MFQRISLYWRLSELSPVWIANASGRPVTGPLPDRVDLADHRVGDVGGEDLLGPVRAASETLSPTSTPHRRLRVDDVHVAELGERQQRPAPVLRAPLGRGAEAGADHVLLAGACVRPGASRRARLALGERGVERGRPAAARAAGRAGDGLGGEAAEGGDATDGGGGTEEVTTGDLHARQSRRRGCSRPESIRFAASSTVSTRCTCASIAPAPGQRAAAAATRARSRSSTSAPDQHHRRDRRLVGVVVLAGVLEDLLDRAAGARAGTRSRRRRPPAGSPRGGRCGSTSRSRWRTRSAARGRSARSGCPSDSAPPGKRSQHVEARRRPGLDRRAERRHRGRAAPGPRRGRSGPAGEPGAEVGRLHRARAAAGRDHEPRAERGPSRAASAYAGSPRWSACPPITPTRCRPRTQLGRARGRSRGRAAPGRAGVRPPALRPGVGAGVEASGTRGVVQLVGGVERVGRRRPAARPAAARAPPRLDRRRRRGERAAEERRAGDLAAGASASLRSTRQPPARSGWRRGQPPVELLERLDVDDAAAGASARAATQKACAISSPNSSCSSTSSPRARNQVHTLAQSRIRKSIPAGCRRGRRSAAGR